MAFSGYSTVANAQDNVMNGTAKAEIRQPLIIEPNPNDPIGGGAGAELSFGIVNGGTTLGTVTLSTTNQSTTTGGATLSSVASTSVAAFAFTGSAGKTYAVTIETPSVTITGTSGDALSSSETMTVDQFVVRPTSAGADQATGTLNGLGQDSFVVGGRLTVKPNQAEGQYAGIFSVSVAYN